MTIRILIVDDSGLVRMGLALVLRGHDDFEIVGEAADGEAAVRSAAALHPNVILMDVRMPGMDGVEATRQIRAANPDQQVLVLTTFDTDESAFGAIEAGATAFLLKDSRPDEIFAAVRAAAAGQSMLSSRVTRELISRYLHHTAGAPHAQERDQTLAELSGREREVLAAMSRGLSNAEIASTLWLSESTVKSHVGSVLQKLGVRDRVQAVLLASRLRLF